MRHPFLLLGGGRFTAPLHTEVDMLRSATVTLTDAQIKTLPTDAIQIVDDPPVGYGIVFVAALVTASIRVAYTNIGVDPGASSFHLSYGWLGAKASAGIINSTDDFAIALTQLLTGTAVAGVSATFVIGGPSVWLAPVAHTATPNLISTGFESQGLYVSMDNDVSGSDNLTGGDAANTIKVTVLYAIVPL